MSMAEADNPEQSSERLSPRPTDRALVENARAEREATALRANLQRRKAQARARTETPKT